jgi:UPF0042 nucleotide-binding protein
MSEPANSSQEVLIVTGMSGAGRSTAGNALEDIGYYVVDNLPPQMLRPLIELAASSQGESSRLAAIVDIRGRNLFTDLRAIVSDVKGVSHVRVLFLDATDETLVRRFESVRRPHPLQGSGTISDGIAAERSRLTEIRELSDIVIDTSDLNVHQLSTQVFETFSLQDDHALHLTIQSFGFKYGLPTDVDLVADARFLPNPFWVPELKHGTGLDDAVSDFVLNAPGARDFLSAYENLLTPVFAGYARENKRYATIAIGCTGGKHRSVALVMELAARLSADKSIAVTIKHRDMGRE